MEFSTVVLSDNSIFLAFFESNSSNKAAAAYAVTSAHQVPGPGLLSHQRASDRLKYLNIGVSTAKLVCGMQAFEAAHATGSGDMQSVLQATFTSLDEGFLADSHYSIMVGYACHSSMSSID